MVSRVIPVESFDLVIFGGTGDLARRKILPGLFRRYCAGQMPPDARIVGAARKKMDADAYRTLIVEAIHEFAPDVAKESKLLDAFAQQLDYVAVDATGDGGWATICLLYTSPSPRDS